MLAKRKYENGVVQRRATEADAEVGRRVRSRRLEKGLSQTDLAEQIGVTFQQVQKYEKGTNRVGAGRLARIAEALNVPITFFFEGAKPTDKANTVFSELQSKGAVRLVKAFNKIESRHARQTLVAMAEDLAAA